MSGSALAYHIAEGPVGGDLAAFAAGELGALGWRPHALCVATSTAGRTESVEFWRAALATDLAFANPRLFPWTLANSPTGSIAIALDVRGPTYTLVGRADALQGAFEHASDDLARGSGTSAAVVAVDMAADRVPTVVAMLVTSPVVACQFGILVGDLESTGRPTEIFRAVLADAQSAATEHRSVHSGNV